MNLTLQQVLGLFILAIPIACIARTVVYEEIFREPREFCQNQCHAENVSWLRRKFFYLFTCEYCFSHYVTLGVLLVARFRLMYDDFRGYLVSFFSLIFIANIYLALYARLRVDLTTQKLETSVKEKESLLKEIAIKKERSQLAPSDAAEAHDSAAA